MCQDLLNKRKTSRGMSILEVAISIVIFGIVVIGLSTPIYTGLSLLVDDGNMTKANNLAKTYLKDLENKWKIQITYDNAELIDINSDYTENGKYTVNVSTEDLHTNTDGIVDLRRVEVNYKNKTGKTLIDIFYDFNRP